MSTINIVMPDGATGPAEVLKFSPCETFAVVKLTGTPHKGTVDAFHVGTGKRATPPRHFATVRNRTAANAAADFLDELGAVSDDGTLRIPREEYHAHFDTFAKGLNS